MSDVHFNQLDLNLLRVFDALLDERSVTRAGDRLGLSQSAVSHALGRLRLTLDDDLFVRRSTGMEPTPRALDIGPVLHTALVQMQTALAPAGFDPAVTERRFTVAAGPYGCAVLIPAVVQALQTQAPGATLHIAAYGEGVIEALDTGRNDAVIMGAGAPETRFRFLRLFDETMVWVVRADHDLTQGELTAQRLLETPHILVSGSQDPFDPEAGVVAPSLKYSRGWDRQDAGELVRRPAARKVAVVTPDSISALAIASRSDMAALVPRRLALSAGAAGRVTILQPVMPPAKLEIGALFREDRLADPAIAWLSRILSEAASAL